METSGRERLRIGRGSVRMPPMARVLVTGANRGIGLELCRRFADRGDDVVACCREPSEALGALPVRVERGVDVTRGEAVAALDERLGGERFDVLVLNAGVLRRDRLDAFDPEGIRVQFEVNALGALRCAAVLHHRVVRGGKVALVTSRMGSIEDNTSGGYYGYRMSKAALNAAGRSLAIDLRSRDVAVVLLHPGFVRTDMTGGMGDLEPTESARLLIERIDALTLEQSGSFLHARGEPLPW